MKTGVSGNPSSPRGGWRGRADISPSAAKQVRRILLTVVGIVLVGALGYLLWAWHFRPVTHFVCLPVIDYHRLAVPPIPFSEEDVQRLEKDLPLAEPATVWRNFGTLADTSKMPGRLQSIGCRPKDTLIFYVCAHGVASGDSAYLLCSDYLLETGKERYALSDLLDQLRAVPAKLKLLILDVGHIRCDPRLGMLANEFPQLLEAAMASGRRDSNLWVLSANRPMQASHASVRSGRSIFGQCLTEGLLGAADQVQGDRDGKVDLGELYAYVCNGVRDRVSQEVGDADAQIPWLLQDGVGEVSQLPGDFLVLVADREQEADQQPASQDDKPPQTPEAASEKKEKKPEAKEPAAQPPPKSLDQLRQLGERIESRVGGRDPSGSGPSWGPVDYAPHRWRELLELLTSYELQHRYGTPILDANLQRTLTDARRDFGGSDGGLQSDQEVGFDAVAQPAERVGQIRTLIQLKNDLLFWAPYYADWYVRTSQASASHQANLYEMISDLLVKLGRLVGQFEAFEQAGLDEESSRDMQARLDRLQQDANDLRALHEKLQETLDDQIRSLAKNPQQRGNPGQIEVLLGIPLLFSSQQAGLQDALAKADWPEPIVAKRAVDLQRLHEAAAGYAAQQEALLPKLAALYRQLCLLAAPDEPIELPPEDASRRPEAYRDLAARLQEFHRRLPEKINAVTAGAPPGAADVRMADRRLRMIDSCSAEGIKPINWPLVRAVVWSEVLISGPAEALSLNWREPAVLPLKIRTAGRSAGTATLTFLYDAEKVRIDDADRPQTIAPGTPITVRLPQGETTLQYRAVPLADDTQALSTDVDVTISAGKESRSSKITLRLPAPDRVRLLAYRLGGSEVAMEEVTANHIRLRPFPNRETGFRFELENLSAEPKELEIRLLGLKGPPPGETPSLAMLFDSLGGLRSDVEALIPAVKMTLQPQDGPRPIEFTLPEPPPAQPPPAEAKEDQPPQPKPSTWACAIYDLGGATPGKPKWLYWIDFLPLIPREYVEIRGGKPQYDAQQGRLTILAQARAVDAGGRPILPADLKENPILITWDSRGGVEPKSSRKQAKLASADAVAELFAQVDPQAGQVMDLDLHVDGYPRGFMYRVECRPNGEVLDMQDQIDVRMTAPAPGRAYRLPLAEPIRVAFAVDAPADAFLDAQRGAAENVVRLQFAGEEGAGSFSPVEIDRYFSDRTMSVFLPKIEPPGVLKVRTEVSDFEVQTSNRGLEDTKVRVEVRLELPNLKIPQGLAEREDSVEIVLDGKPPVIRVIRFDSILPGQPAVLVFDAEDLSGITEVQARFSEAKTQKLEDGKPLTVSPQQGEDGRWQVSLPTDDLKKPGTYWLLWRVSDRAGNVTETMVDELAVRAPPSTDKPPATTGTIEGRVVSPNGDPRAGAQVTLEPLGTLAETDSGGKFTFADVPPGTYTLRVEQRIKGQAASNSKQVQVKAGEKLVVDKIELSMWSKEDE